MMGNMAAFVYDRVVKVASNQHYQQILHAALPRAKNPHMADIGSGLRDTWKMHKGQVWVLEFATGEG